MKTGTSARPSSPNCADPLLREILFPIVQRFACCVSDEIDAGRIDLEQAYISGCYERNNALIVSVSAEDRLTGKVRTVYELLPCYGEDAFVSLEPIVIPEVIARAMIGE